MDPVNRNEHYGSVSSDGMGLVTRNDTDQVRPHHLPQPVEPFYYVRLFGVGMGVLVVASGIYLAGASFTVVRGILESPQKLNGYLDEWYIPPKETAVAQVPAESKPADVPNADQKPAPTPQAEAVPKDSPKPAEAPSQPSNAEKGGPPAATAKPEPSPTSPPVPLPMPRHSPAAVKGNTSPWHDGIELLTDALTRGGLPRLAGALVLLLLVSMLIRIPFGLLKAGTDLIKAVLPDKSKSTN